MVILHIACIKDDLFSGVCVVVPQHIKAQSQYATVGFINVNNEKHVFFNGYTFNFSTLPPILIQWVKTAVSVPIVCGFAAYCVHKIYDFIASRFLRSTDKNAGGDSE